LQHFGAGANDGDDDDDDLELDFGIGDEDDDAIGSTNDDDDDDDRQPSGRGRNGSARSPPPPGGADPHHSTAASMPIGMGAMAYHHRAAARTDSEAQGQDPALGLLWSGEARSFTETLQLPDAPTGASVPRFRAESGL
jgi:hypothetical protein